MKITKKILSKIWIIFLISSLLSCRKEGKIKNYDINTSSFDKSDMNAFQNYFLPHEQKRALYSLENDVAIKDSNGNIVGILYKGFQVKDPNMFDLGDVDIGDNNKMAVMIDFSEKSYLKEIGLIKDKDSEVYKADIKE